ncbi:hypothetical protein HZA43_03995 [Candidatus Peregrinibacteria bacterium]|nr:hypothetical protein [Candidatus Peregrinibacteria bacterium]
MSLRRIKHSLLRLSAEEKIVGIGCLVTLLSLFFPWYSTTFLSSQKSLIENGLSGDLGVIGFVVFIMTLIAGLYLVAENLRVRLPYFGLPKQKIVLFIMGEASFLMLLLIAVYTKRSLGFTNAELRFGIYSAFIGTIASTLAMISALQKRQREETRAFFDHPEESDPVETQNLASKKPEPLLDPEPQNDNISSVETRHVASSDVPHKIPTAQLDENELEEDLFRVKKPTETISRSASAERSRSTSTERSRSIDIESYKERYQVPETDVGAGHVQPERSDIVETRLPTVAGAKEGQGASEKETTVSPTATDDNEEFFTLKESEPLEEMPINETENDKEKPIRIEEIRIDEIKEKISDKKGSPGGFYED